ALRAAGPLVCRRPAALHQGRDAVRAEGGRIRPPSSALALTAAEPRSPLPPNRCCPRFFGESAFSSVPLVSRGPPFVAPRDLAALRGLALLLSRFPRARGDAPPRKQGEPLEELRDARLPPNEPAEKTGSPSKDKDHERQENDADRRRRAANRGRREEELLDPNRDRFPEQGRLVESAFRLPAGPPPGDHHPAAGHRSQRRDAARAVATARRSLGRGAEEAARPGGALSAGRRPMHDHELDSFKRDIHLVQFAVERYGYVRDRRESSVSSHVLRHEASRDKLVVRRDADGHWTYFSVRDGRDSGTVIDFVQARRGRGLREVREELRRYLGRPHPPFELPRAPSPAAPPEPRAVGEAFVQALRAETSPYLNARGLRPETLRDMRFAETWRLGPRQNVLFVHTDDAGVVTGFEVKNHGFTGFATGGARRPGKARSGRMIARSSSPRAPSTHSAITSSIRKREATPATSAPPDSPARPRWTSSIGSSPDCPGRARSSLPSTPTLPVTRSRAASNPSRAATASSPSGAKRARAGRTGK